MHPFGRRLVTVLGLGLRPAMGLGLRPAMGLGLLLLLVLGLGAAAGGCSDKKGASSKPSRRDARATPKRPPDGGPPVARTAARPVVLHPGCRCAPVSADAVLAHRAARQAFVERMDALNRSARTFIERLDEAAGRTDPPSRIEPEPHRERHRVACCRLDCLLAQFVGLTPAAWAWARQAGALLDRARPVLARLAVSPDERAEPAGLTRLVKRYNEVARTSNRSIGIALLAPRTPRVPVPVDSLSFRAKARRIGADVRKLLGAFRERWLEPAADRSRGRASGAPPSRRARPRRRARAARRKEPTRRARPARRPSGAGHTQGARPARASKAAHPRDTGPPHPLAAGRMRFTVEAARLSQRLRALRDRARALLCGKGKTCPARQKRWTVAIQALEAVVQELPRTVRRVRAAGQGPLSFERCRALLAPLRSALQTFHSRLDEVAGTR